MVALLKIRDEYFGTKADDDPAPVELRLVSERVSPREIIRQRVFGEVADVNEARIDFSRRNARTRSLLIQVEPDSPEARLNPSRLIPRRKTTLLDAEAEFAKALTAFGKNRFIMLFDERQVEDLDEVLVVTPDSEAIFIHLTPLKGG